ncbi:PNGase F N-terminal domain-containing protein [Pedobacter aquatilis]|uniref:PNGase F N-terminal domain-containing protein n=1 Tax=Pedobacter aquatilis TaxID=351343 RepID=UPI0025B5B859|nr:PNGase F N-terminal domain-containing protein [Pedobacter aquatilis]MDN3585278.1 PNGase F N-terminal domain-containing protein [Pedobacter aquatilis]
MKPIYSLLFLITIPFLINAQQKLKPGNNYKITYWRSADGKPKEDRNPVVLIASTNQNLITTASIFEGNGRYPFEQNIVEKPSNILFQMADLNKTTQIATADSTAIAKQVIEITNETKVILGYTCKKATTVVNSNRIDLWFTVDAGIKAAPTVLGQNLGLVLEQVRNGNSYLTATSIKAIKSTDVKDFTGSKSKIINALDYKDLLWKSRFTTLKVFENETINFIEKPQSKDSIFRFAGGTVIARKVKFPSIENAQNVFADLTEQSNGDAYDRTGSVFIIPTDKKISLIDALKNSVKVLPVYDNGNGKQYQGVVTTTDFTPVVELMRFFTPFGVGKYNNLKLKGKTWAEQVFYRQDISELFPLLNGKEAWVAVFIGNYDKGGHKVSLNITLHNAGRQKPEKDIIMPLFNTTNVMEMAGQEYATMFSIEKGLEVSFILDKDVKNAKLRYITTGHGGWSNGDEFVPKKNSIWLDGKETFSFVPWRQDCGSYRLSNPASGNFETGLSSSDLSRSNWCPGTVTNPNFIDLGDLKAGSHTIKVSIPMGKPEGGSSSAWNVSGVLIGKE